jgi:hypothetical protein
LPSVFIAAVFKSMTSSRRAFAPSAAPSVFDSFWMGGFEGADHVNSDARPLDMSLSTGHLDRIDDDYRRAAQLGIRTVRESVGWRLAEPEPGRYDLDRVMRISRSAEKHGLQVLWTFMHYGMPADLSLHDDALGERFARFASTLAGVLAPLHTRAPVYNLINEISFLAWAASATNMIHPYRGDADGIGEGTGRSGYDIKRRLVRASVLAMRAVQRMDARARFLQVEPVIHVVAPADRPELEPMATEIAGYQWQVWDMLAGRCDPALGGEPALLDLIGVNHYHSSQWEAQTEARLDWHARDARRRPFAGLLHDTWQRYHRPMIVAETSHFGDGRAAWLSEIASEVELALRSGVPVEGICLYPLVDRHDWQDHAHWHHSGLWDILPAACPPGESGTPTGGAAPPSAGPRGELNVEPCADYADALRHWQQLLPRSQSSEKEPGAARSSFRIGTGEPAAS